MTIRSIRYKLLLACLIAAPFFAHAAPPTTASIDRLLELTGSRKLIDSGYPQIEGMMKSMMEQSLDVQHLPPQEAARANGFIASFINRSVPAIREEMSWAHTKDMYEQIYRDTFSQQEIDGLIQFYESPAGQAYVAKMPVVMQKTMAAMQLRMGPLVKKLEQAASDAAREFNAKPATTK